MSGHSLKISESATELTQTTPGHLFYVYVLTPSEGEQNPRRRWDKASRKWWKSHCPNWLCWKLNCDLQLLWPLQWIRWPEALRENVGISISIKYSYELSSILWTTHRHVVGTYDNKHAKTSKISESCRSFPKNNTSGGVSSLPSKFQVKRPNIAAMVTDKGAKAGWV